MNSIRKNIKLKTREDGIVKDTNSNTFIYPRIIRKYLKILDGTFEFLDDDKDSKADTEESNDLFDDIQTDYPKPPCYPLKKINNEVIDTSLKE